MTFANALMLYRVSKNETCGSSGVVRDSLVAWRSWCVVDKQARHEMSNSLLHGLNKSWCFMNK